MSLVFTGKLIEELNQRRGIEPEPLMPLLTESGYGIPTAHVEWLVNKLHIRSPDIAVQKALENRMKGDQWNDDLRKAVIHHGLTHHRKNQTTLAKSLESIEKAKEKDQQKLKEEPLNEVNFEKLMAPAHWASYFINGDASGLDDKELAQADAWLKRNKVINVVDVDEPYFSWSVQVHAPEVDYKGGDLAEYTVELAEGKSVSVWERSKRGLNRFKNDAPTYHQLRIARQTLNAPDEMVGVMGGMNKDQARALLKKHGLKEEDMLEEQPADLTGKIMDYEEGNMSEDEMVTFFQELVDSGLAWQLQGHYGRTAEALIQAGLVRSGPYPKYGTVQPGNIKKEGIEGAIERAAARLSRNEQLGEGYKVVRFYRDHEGKKRTIKRGLSLQDAQRHCNDPETSSSTAKGAEATRHTKRWGPWFDGYQQEGYEPEGDQLDELSPPTLGNYVKRRVGSAAAYGFDNVRHQWNTAIGVDRAIDRLQHKRRIKGKSKWVGYKAEGVELDESYPTRKHFKMVADLIKREPDEKKRQQLANHHAELFAKQNPRFDHARFHAAAGTKHGVSEDRLNEISDKKRLAYLEKATASYVKPNKKGVRYSKKRGKFIIKTGEKLGIIRKPKVQEDREIGTPELTRAYASMTPGQGEITMPIDYTPKPQPVRSIVHQVREMAKSGMPLEEICIKALAPLKVIKQILNLKEEVRLPGINDVYRENPRLVEDVSNLLKKLKGEKMNEQGRDYGDDDYDEEEWRDRVDRFADPGGKSALHPATKDNPRIYPCPTCGRENVLTGRDVQKGYQCDHCADAEERGGW